MEIKRNYYNCAGVYKITCMINDKSYIGKSVNILKRMNAHKNCKKPDQKMSYFHEAILKYGWDSFTVEILESFPVFDKQKDNVKLLEREAFYIKKYRTTDKNFGYNLCAYSNDGTGRPLSEEHKQKLRIMSSGKTHTQSAKDKVSEANLGRKFTIEHREKLRRAKLGIKRGPFSEEHKEKLRQANIGKKMSLESRVKMSEANRGKVLKPEHIEKLRLANLGRPRTPETIEKIKLGNIGKKKKPWTDEQREKIKQTKIKNKQLKKQNESTTNTTNL
jgi:group I intron endonuclease